jgi:hypothetical protein
MDRKRERNFLMAHFAKLNDDNKVVQVIILHNQELLDAKGIESEWKGIEFCIQHYGGRWIQTSYNANFRKNYAGIGFTYDEVLDAFIPPSCHEEATLNEESARWSCENEEHNYELS